MRQAIIEFLELIARAIGIRASSEMPASGGQSLLIIGVLIVGAIGLAWLTGRLTSTSRLEGEGEMILRGGFALVFYGGLALIFVAGVAWAWGSLFG